MVPDYATPDGKVHMTIRALVVESEGRRILVDTCLGNDKQRPVESWSMRSGPFLDDLAAAGFPPESIDTVLCTHLHVDHVGWNTRLVDGAVGADVPGRPLPLRRRRVGALATRRLGDGSGAARRLDPAGDRRRSGRSGRHRRPADGRGVAEADTRPHARTRQRGDRERRRACRHHRRSRAHGLPGDAPRVGEFVRRRPRPGRDDPPSVLP